MSTQFAIVLALIGGALLYIGRATWKTWSGSKGGCASGCGKCAIPTPAAKGRLSLPMV